MVRLGGRSDDGGRLRRRGNGGRGQSVGRVRCRRLGRGEQPRPPVRHEERRKAERTERHDHQDCDEDPRPIAARADRRRRGRRGQGHTGLGDWPGPELDLASHTGSSPRAVRRSARQAHHPIGNAGRLRELGSVLRFDDLRSLHRRTTSRPRSSRTGSVVAHVDRSGTASFHLDRGVRSAAKAGRAVRTAVATSRFAASIRRIPEGLSPLPCSALDGVRWTTGRTQSRRRPRCRPALYASGNS